MSTIEKLKALEQSATDVSMEARIDKLEKLVEQLVARRTNGHLSESVLKGYEE